jgi:Zn-dependent peptidase ImmA (M78 family)
MNPERRREINELAEAIREACDLSTPADMSEAVGQLGGQLELVDKPDYEARIQRGDDGFLISLARQSAETRMRFNIAHELGHLFLHMGYLDDRWGQVGDYTDSVYYRYGYGEEEYEAHEFAGAFLMPRVEFHRIASSAEDGGTYDVTVIAAHFGVSRKAAIMRGRWLGLFSWE